MRRLVDGPLIVVSQFWSNDLLKRARCPQGLRISHPQALRLLIRMCLENTDLELKLRVFTVLRDLVGANSPNKAVCGEAGVIDLLIEDHVQV